MFDMPNHPTAPALVVFVDVDDTLVRSMGGKRIPLPEVIRHVRALHEQGAVLYCWSAGGAEYARASAEEFGVTECFTGFLPKPNVMLDDQGPASWPDCLVQHPSGCSGAAIEDYRKRLRP
jgi:hypothetical protein